MTRRRQSHYHRPCHRRFLSQIRYLFHRLNPNRYRFLIPSLIRPQYLSPNHLQFLFQIRCQSQIPSRCQSLSHCLNHYRCQCQ